MGKELKIKKEGTTLFVKLDYELSTGNASSLQEEMAQYRGQGIKQIMFDATDLVFISSAGIRVVIFAQQRIGNEPEILSSEGESDGYPCHLNYSLRPFEAVIFRFPEQ